MTEDISFPAASLAGFLVGIVTIFLFTRYFTLSSGNNVSEKPLENETAAQKIEGSNQQLLVTKESEFPHDWFTSTQTFDLETRAIFSKVDNPSTTTTYPHSLWHNEESSENSENKRMKKGPKQREKNVG